MKYFFFGLLFVTTSIFAQKNINNYKYVIVPNKFDFVKTADKYQTSSLTKFLFNKYGYKAFLSNETLPKDLTKNRCLALVADVKEASGMFTTKNIIELKDCNNNVLFTSQEGKSKVKDYKKAYHEAIRKAFKSVQGLKYAYVPVKEEVEVEEVKPQEKVVLPSSKKVTTKSLEVLYAQPKSNGFQLVNTKPEVVFEVLTTTVKDVFIIKNKNGILYKSGKNWIAEFYKNGNKVVKTVEVKF